MAKSKVIVNQERILSNQEQIKENQHKLDQLLASQETILTNQEAIRQLESRLSQLLEVQGTLLPEDDPIGEMVGASEAFQEAMRAALLASETDVTVLVRGETGTGKELLAHAIHTNSPRSQRPFVIVNCAALPAALIESELFGYEKGAFTGALQRKPGRFELADGGTIFLDEIGEVPLELQGRFLRVLQTGVFEPLGGSTSMKVKIRIIAATNQPLENLVNQQKFRADLFYRLNVMPITLPPLRERKDDIPLLVKHFAQKFSARFKRPLAAVSEESLRALYDYHFPGNIRELEHLVERAVIKTQGDVLRLELPDIMVEPTVPLGRVEDLPRFSAPVDPPTLSSLANNERKHIERVLRYTRGRISGSGGAAEILQINPSTLRSRIKKLDINFETRE